MQTQRLAVVALLVFALAPASADAMTEVWVTTTLDFVDPDLTDGICGYRLRPNPDGTHRPPFCSLRAAIQEANNGAPEQFAIDMIAGRYRLNARGAGEDLAATGDLDVWGDVIIFGTGAMPSTCPRLEDATRWPFDVLGCARLHVINATTIAGHGDRVFDVHPGARLQVYSVSIVSGRAHGTGPGPHPPLAGGAIRNQGALQVAHVGFAHNSADTGGALYNSGEAYLTFVSMSQNSARSTQRGGCGGAILNEGLVRITNAVFYRNDTDGDGGAICNHSQYTRGFPMHIGDLEFDRSLEMNEFAVINNAGHGDGGGIASTSSMWLLAGTIRWNYGVSGAGVMVDQFDPEDRYTALDVVDVSHNFATWGRGDSVGGGLMVRGNVLLREARIDSNETQHGGAGLWVHGDGDVQVSLSVISRNDARNIASVGGGVGGALSGAGHVALMNTTISGNIAGSGAGVGMSGPKGTNLELKFMTVAGNHATSRGANIWTDRVFLSMRNTLLVLGTTDRGADCVFGVLMMTSGRNFTDDGSCVRGIVELEPIPLVEEDLLNHGGTTETHALAPGSAARDAVSLANCDPDIDLAPLSIDQRWIPRPQGLACDAGAYEYEGLSLLEQAGHLPPSIELRSSAGRLVGAAIALQLALQSTQQPSKDVDAALEGAQQLGARVEEMWSVPDEQSLKAKLAEVHASFAALQKTMQGVQVCCQHLPDQRPLRLLEYAFDQVRKLLGLSEKPPTPIEK